MAVSLDSIYAMCEAKQGSSHHLPNTESRTTQPKIAETHTPSFTGISQYSARAQDANDTTTRPRISSARD